MKAKEIKWLDKPSSKKTFLYEKLFRITVSICICKALHMVNLRDHQLSIVVTSQLFYCGSARNNFACAASREHFKTLTRSP